MGIMVVGTLAAGCQAPADRLQLDNFRQIRTTVSSQADVANGLGEPDTKLDGQWLYERPSKHLRAIIDFDGEGRVTRAQWIDAIGGAWEDTGGAAPAPRDAAGPEPRNARGTGKP